VVKNTASKLCAIILVILLLIYHHIKFHLWTVVHQLSTNCKADTIHIIFSVFGQLL